LKEESSCATTFSIHQNAAKNGKSDMAYQHHLKLLHLFYRLDTQKKMQQFPNPCKKMKTQKYQLPQKGHAPSIERLQVHAL
jgi:hypothetical protein